MTRYPLQSLLDAAGISMTALRELFPMSGQTYRTARTQGLTEQQADRYACTLGLVPWLVWPDWLDDAQVECADEKCGRRFVPRTRAHRFCSTLCGNRDRTRLRLAEKRKDPAFREAERLRRAAFYAQSAGYEARRQRVLWRTDERFREVKEEARRRWRQDPANRERENARARELYRLRKEVA